MLNQAWGSYIHFVFPRSSYYQQLLLSLLTLIHILLLVTNFINFILSKFKLICFKPFVKLSKGISNAVFKVIAVGLIVIDTSIISKARRFGL